MMTSRASCPALSWSQLAGMLLNTGSRWSHKWFIFKQHGHPRLMPHQLLQIVHDLHHASPSCGVPHQQHIPGLC